MHKALIVALIGFGLTWTLVSQSPPQAGQRLQASEIERGKYLVHNVAKCIECHSPRDARGDLDARRLLQGAPIPLTSPFPNRPWAFQAPAIAGLPGWSEAEAVYLLTHGSRMSGQIPKGPMPRFSMTPEDARAVVAYLKSL